MGRDSGTGDSFKVDGGTDVRVQEATDVFTGPTPRSQVLSGTALEVTVGHVPVTEEHGKILRAAKDGVSTFTVEDPASGGGGSLGEQEVADRDRVSNRFVKVPHHAAQQRVEVARTDLELHMVGAGHRGDRPGVRKLVGDVDAEV